MTKELRQALFAVSMLPLLLAMNFVTAVFVMLGLGVLHSHWPVIPAFGYWESYLTLALLHIVMRFSRPIKYPQSLEKK